MTEEERAALLRELAETKAAAAQVRKILDTIPTFASCNLPDGSNEFLPAHEMPLLVAERVITDEEPTVLAILPPCALFDFKRQAA